MNDLVRIIDLASKQIAGQHGLIAQSVSSMDSQPSEEQAGLELIVGVTQG